MLFSKSDIGPIAIVVGLFTAAVLVATDIAAGLPL